VVSVRVGARVAPSTGVRKLRRPVATSSPSFNPLTDLPSLVLWLDASQLTGLSDGDAVASWTDLTANADHAVQATPTKRPTYETNVLNGLPVIRFDGVDDALVTSNVAIGTQKITVWAVVSATSGGDRIIAEANVNFTIVSDAWMLLRGAANTVSIATREAIPYGTADSVATVTTTHRVVVATYDKSLSTNEGTISIDGDNSFTRVNNANHTGTFGTYPVYVGARNAASFFLAGDIAEVGVCNAALTGADLTELQTYLTDKWGIT
jgi:hypothetical protein